jgi:hypothetical protein
MSKKRRNRRRAIATLAELFDQVGPDEIDEAREELRAFLVDPSAAARRLEQMALRSIRERILREHADAARARIHTCVDVDLTNKLD